MDKTNMKESKIIGIQFSVLSPQEIKNLSVVEIKSKETYSANKPVIGGIFDPRMGVAEKGMICPTDRHNYIISPGYFGHIVMARPVFYIQYLNTVMKVLRCICFKCGKLLIDKQNHEYLNTMRSENRWKKVSELCKKVQMCGKETSDGCGCIQPLSYKKESVATVIATWKQDNTINKKIVLKITPEIALSLLSRISDDDISFMGFSPVYSRPEWFICQVMAVPPPCVRPSIKNDAQQRSEDDLSHILIYIIKTNNELNKHIKKGSASNKIDDITVVLQYYVASFIDNKIPKVPSIAQRSGRLLKPIKERLSGKPGRVRGNLMAKRVNYSARSVITADPNISISELGVPLKIAKNITKPVIVNDKNRNYLMQLILNGPDSYPGAKVLERDTGENISLRFADREKLVLKDGDIVHRHLMDGDIVIFNRQPTLHRMSMMGHRVKIMKKGDTFRLNVAVTKPYNADFDGDEMNMHMPQDLESDVELIKLACVENQIISPANNKPIIGIFQDSMVGSYLFTRENIVFNKEQAMTLVANIPRVNIKKLFMNSSEYITSFEILSQILPPLSLFLKNKRFSDENDDIKTSNNIVEIKNGEFIRGLIDKDILHSGTNGIIHRIFNDFGPKECVEFIDNFQKIITNYIMISAFSVGISDLMTNERVKQEIKDKINEKKKLISNKIDELQLGVFKHTTGGTKQEAFEQEITSILNEASNDAGKIGVKNLPPNNRFTTMVNSGSKGSQLNITQMISCLGQQNIDGKRIPYGFENRTLPHFTKYDDTPTARGFVENSFIVGLEPHELFFHAMGGRIGLIDTAVKTSKTGYIQRRIIKGLEDLMVYYDGTVRNNKNVIVQFNYGEDGIDGTKIENQNLELVNMSLSDIYNHYTFPFKGEKIFVKIFTNEALQNIELQTIEYSKLIKKYIDMMIFMRDEIVNRIFKGRNDTQVRSPISFKHIIANISNQQQFNINSIVDITPYECILLLEDYYTRLEKSEYFKPTSLFKVLYYFYLSPKELLYKKRFNRKTLILLLETIIMYYKKSLVAPGEMVGLIAAQSLGEVSTQMSLEKNTLVSIIKMHKKTKETLYFTQTIEELINGLMKNNLSYIRYTNILHDSTETLIDNFEEKFEYYIQSVDKYEKVDWQKISHVSKHPVNGQLMKITTSSGRSVTTTLSHSHLTRDEYTQTIQPIEGRKLTVDMYIPSLKITPEFPNITTSNSIFIEFIALYLVYGNIKNNYINISNFPSSIKISEIVKYLNLNEEDYYISDVLFNIRNIDIVEKIGKMCGNNDTNKQIPDFLFTVSNEYKKEFLKILFFKYGSITKFPNEVKLYLSNLNILQQISSLLNYFKIYSSITQISSVFYKLYIVGDSIVEFKQQFTFRYETNIKTEIDNHALMHDDFEIVPNILSILKYVESLVNISFKSSVKYLEDTSRANIYLYLEKIKNSELKLTLDSYSELTKYMQLLVSTLESNVVWEKIISIELLETPQTEYVYDFTIPGNETFMCANGLMVHNTLNTFHFAGIASKSNVTRGVPRMEELLTVTANPKNPSLTIFLKEEDENDQQKVISFMHNIEYTKLSSIVESSEIIFDPDDKNTLISEDKTLIDQYYEFEELIQDCNNGNSIEPSESSSKWIIRIKLDYEKMIEKNITMEEVSFTLYKSYGNMLHCIYSDFNSDNLVIRLRLTEIIKKSSSMFKNKTALKTLDQTDQIYILKNFQIFLMNNTIIRGINKIKHITPRQLKHFVKEVDGKYIEKPLYVLDTIGTNLMEVLCLPFIDPYRTFSNDIIEIYNVLGIEAVREILYNELSEAIEFDGTYVNYRHFILLIDRMLYSGKILAMFRHGINIDDIGPIAKASFEETPEMFIKAARHSELENMRGISANIMCGQKGFYGTSAFKVLINTVKLDELNKNIKSQIIKPQIDKYNIEGLINSIKNKDITIDNLKINNGLSHIKPYIIDFTEDDELYELF